MPGQEVVWPYELTPEEHALGMNGMRQKYISSMLGDVGDVTDPRWPPPELLQQYDRMNRSDFWRSRGASSEAIALLTVGGMGRPCRNTFKPFHAAQSGAQSEARPVLQDERGH